jgi:hypothetical protein
MSAALAKDRNRALRRLPDVEKIARTRD